MRSVTSGLLMLTVLATAAPAAEFPAEHLFVCSVGSQGEAVRDGTVIEVDGDGAVVGTFASGLDDPRGLVFGPDGLLYVTSGDQILGFDAAGEVARTIGPGTALEAPRGLAFGARGHLFATSTDLATGSARILEFDSTGAEVRALGDGSGLTSPVGLAFGPDGRLYVASGGQNRVFVFEPGGAKVGEIGAGTSLSVPTGLAFDADGRLHVASLFNNSVVVFDAAGAQVDTISDAALALPAGVAFGPEGHLYVSSLFGGKVSVFDATGAKVRELPAEGAFSAPEGLAFAPVCLDVTIQGKLHPAGGPAQSVKVSGVLSLSPASRILLLDVGDAELAASLDLDGVVVHGFASAKNAADKQRQIQGQAFGPGGSHTSSLHLEVGGKIVDYGGADAFQPTSAKGTLHLSAEGAVLKASVKSTGGK